jgi:hypothetical protein
VKASESEKERASAAAVLVFRSPDSELLTMTPFGRCPVRDGVEAPPCDDPGGIGNSGIPVN